MSVSGAKVSIVIPAKNEAAAIGTALSQLLSLYPAAEVIVVNDGSSDETAKIASSVGAIVISHPYSKGNGAAIKTGARHSTRDTIVFMDADGQHDPKDIARLLKKLEQGFDMVVGSRDRKSQADWGRLTANSIYNQLSSWMVGQKIADLTSGFRAVNSVKFKELMSLLPNGFSYPTTITMAFFKVGYSVGYESIRAHKRLGRSHIKPVRDGVRFFLIIFKIASLYSPLKLFFPISFFQVCLGGGYYIYTYLSEGRFTNMGAFLLSSSVIVFLIGLVSEQITMLLYTTLNRNKSSD